MGERFTADFADVELDPLHERVYQVRSYRIDDAHLLLRGVVHDEKPAGLYFPGDPRPLPIHHMVVDLVVDFPTLQISDAAVRMETHPHDQCPRITEHYEALVGLSIARGFTHKVRELFGGPRGCTHTTALLQAMAPVAVQSMWSMRAAGASGTGDEGVVVVAPTVLTPEQRRASMAFNFNSCHVWAEDGPMVQALDEGEMIETPIWATERMRDLGLDESAWMERFRG